MPSLQGALRSCQVDSGWATKLYSDRLLNPNQMLCPVWNQVDTSGRPVCADSYYTKTPGCNSAGDRVNVENDLRPQYIEYVTLDAAGIRGGQNCPAQAISADTQCHQATMDMTHKYTGQFGMNTGFSQNVNANCVTCKNKPDERAYGSNAMRGNQWGAVANKIQSNRRAGGF